MPKGTVTEMQVIGKSWITPHLVRLELAGPDGAALADFPMSPHADAYVKLVLPPRGVSLPWPYDAEALKESLPPEQWPVMRTYTIRDFTPERMLLDVVVHGDEGVAGPWARDVEPFGPDSLLQVRGPAVRTPRTPTPDTTCWWVTPRPCRPSPSPWSASRSAPRRMW